MDKYAQLCRYLLDHIDSTFYTCDHKLISWRSYFAVCLIDYTVTPADDRTVPHRHDIQLLLATSPDRLPHLLVTPHLGLAVSRLDKTNVNQICEVLGLVIDAYHGVDRALRDDIEALVFRVQEATQAMHWRDASHGDALMQKWVLRRTL